MFSINVYRNGEFDTWEFDTENEMTEQLAKFIEIDKKSPVLGYTYRLFEYVKKEIKYKEVSAIKIIRD